MPWLLSARTTKKFAPWLCALSGPERFDEARGQRGDAH
jgi:hypothetical protein